MGLDFTSYSQPKFDHYAHKPSNLQSAHQQRKTPYSYLEMIPRKAIWKIYFPPDFLKESGISNNLFPSSPYFVRPITSKGTTDVRFRAGVTVSRGSKLHACKISYLQLIIVIWLDIGASDSDAKHWGCAGPVLGTGVLKAVPAGRSSISRGQAQQLAWWF